jgi:hypothetical protein
MLVTVWPKKCKAENYLHRMGLSRSLFVHKLDLLPVDRRWKHGLAIFGRGCHTCYAAPEAILICEFFDIVAPAARMKIWPRMVQGCCAEDAVRLDR